MKGWTGWALLVLIIALIDILAPENETLSEALWRAKKRYPAFVFWAVLATAVHLLAGDHPSMRRIDVFKLIGVSRKAIRKATS